MKVLTKSYDQEEATFRQVWNVRVNRQAYLRHSWAASHPICVMLSLRVSTSALDKNRFGLTPYLPTPCLASWMRCSSYDSVGFERCSRNSNCLNKRVRQLVIIHTAHLPVSRERSKPTILPVPFTPADAVAVFNDLWYTYKKKSLMIVVKQLVKLL